MKQFHIGVKGLIVQDDTVLILHCVDGFWELPGGRMEEGEDIQDTLRRELREELPALVDYSVGKLISAYKIPHEYAPPTGLMLIFYAVTAQFKDDFVLSAEHDAYRWATKQEALELLNEAGKDAVIHYFGG